jgi:hypothetical protein
LNRLIKSIVSAFSPSNLSNLELWGKFNDLTTLNAKLSAKFTASDVDFLSSSSTDFNFGNEDFSWIFWVKIDDVTAGEYIGGQYNPTGNNRSYSALVSGSTIIWRTSNDGTATISTTSGAVANDTWYMVTCVYDSVNDLQKISLNDGAYVTTANTVGCYAGNNADFILSGYTGGGNIDANMDAVGIYGKALTTAQRDVIYGGGNGTAYDNLTADGLTSLVSWYQLNESSGIRYDAHASNDLTDNASVGYGLGKVQESIANNEHVWRFTDQSNNAFLIDQNSAVAQPQLLNSKELLFNGATMFENLDDLITPLASTTTGTWCMWVKPTSAPFSGADTMFCFGDANASSLIYISFNAVGVRAFCNIAGVTQWQIDLDADPFVTSTWCHVVLVMDGVLPKIRINNVEVAQTVTTSTDTTIWFNDYSGALDRGRLGCRNFNTDTNDLFLSASIGEPLIYGNNKSVAELTSIYNYSLSTYS